MKSTTIAVLLLAPLGVLSTASEIQEAVKAPTHGDAGTCDAIPIAEAHYSFGTEVAHDGTVLFTEFNRREIKRWNPIDGTTDVWRTKQTPGMFGVCANNTGDVFVGIDLGDNGNPGKVLRIGADGMEAHIIEGITRPRQLACDLAGNLFVALENGKILKWDHGTDTSSEIMSAQPPVNGIAVGPDGSVYVSEYANFKHMAEGYSHPETAGVVKVRRPDGTISVLASGVWRARGLALSGTRLYLCTEADREDHGNSGLLVRIKTFQAVSNPAPDVQKASVRGGRITWTPSVDGTSFTIQSQSRTLEGYLHLDEGALSMDGYIEVPANKFDLSLDPLYHTFDSEHPYPGIFELPSVEAKCASGSIKVEVIPLRCHQGQRWPMQNVGTPNESPAPGFSEQPEAFRFYFHWSPSDNKQK